MSTSLWDSDSDSFICHIFLYIIEYIRLYNKKHNSTWRKSQKKTNIWQETFTKIQGSLAWRTPRKFWRPSLCTVDFYKSMFCGMDDVLWLILIPWDVPIKNQPCDRFQGQIWFFNKWSQEQVLYAIYMWFWPGYPFLVLFLWHNVMFKVKKTFQGR